MHLGECLRQSAALRPEKAALICGGETVSYRALDGAVDGLARWLAREGLRPGDRVAIHSKNSIEAIELFFACFRAGAIAVPVNWRMKAPEVGYVLEHSGAKLCFTQPGLEEIVTAAHPACRVMTALPAGVTDGAAFPEPGDEEIAVLLYTSGTTARPR